LPTETERRLEQLENILLFGGGVAAGTASGRQLARAAATAAARAAPRAAGTAGLIAKRHPVASVVALGYVAHRMGLGPIETAEFIAEELAEPAMGMRGRIGLHGATPPDPVKLKKRKVSKANKAVKHAMNMLRAGSKGATGAAKGSLPKGAWSMATKAAGLANPKTKSKIGKGASKLKRLARTLKRWW
jgi:hypothetical protein